MRLVLALALVLQTATNPTTVEFIPSADHATATVTSYRLDIFPIGVSTPSHVIDLGKPTPVNALITVPLQLPSPLVIGTTYQARVVAVGPGGETASAWSNPFVATSTQLPPGALTFPRLVLGAPPGPPLLLSPGLTGTYFPTATLTGTPVVRIDTMIDMAWGTGGPPLAGIGVDDFSVRWTGFVTAPTTATYTFYTQTDDGVRLWVGGTPLVNQWIGQAETEHSGTIALVAGQATPITVEYFEAGGDAVARLLWSAAGLAKTAVPATAFSHP